MPLDCSLWRLWGCRDQKSASWVFLACFSLCVIEVISLSSVKVVYGANSNGGMQTPYR